MSTKVCTKLQQFTDLYECGCIAITVALIYGLGPLYPFVPTVVCSELQDLLKDVDSNDKAMDIMYTHYRDVSDIAAKAVQFDPNYFGLNCP